MTTPCQSPDSSKPARMPNSDQPDDRLFGSSFHACNADPIETPEQMPTKSEGEMAKSGPSRRLRFRGQPAVSLDPSASDAPIVEKDLLRTGRWHLGNQLFEVTRATLEQLVKNFRSARSAGNRIPWIWNHDGKAQDRIGDLIDLQIRGQTLVGQLQVLDESAKLSFGNQPGELTFQEVSIEITEHWVDGKGNQYPLAITHVANVLNPVVPNQKPFRRVFANSAVVGNTPSADLQTSEHTELARLVRRLNRMFNTQLPESVKSLRELNARLLLGPTNAADGKVAARSTPTQQFQLDDAGRQAKYQFAQAIDKLIVDNRLTPAEGKELMRTANLYQIYELALLKPYQRLGSAMPNYSIEQLLASEQPQLVDESLHQPRIDNNHPLRKAFGV